jgi:nucleotide-binding universal stress UspA family protein
MITLERILVPHDFSDPAIAAQKYATALARTFNANLDILHVRQRPSTEVTIGFPLGIEGSLDAAARQCLLTLVSAQETPELNPDLQVRCGTPHAEITRYAKERDIDLIVMGTHGRRGLAHAVMGSVAEKVVRTASCPVLTLRRPQHDLAARNILVATDFGTASETALIYSRALAHVFGARLHLLHVMENCFMRAVVCDPHALEARARQHLVERLTDEDRHTLQATAALEVSETPAQAIVEYASEMNIDLIVMGTHGRAAIDHVLVGSVAERVIRTAPCPVLTVRHPEREFVVPDAPADAHVASAS